MVIMATRPNVLCGVLTRQSAGRTCILHIVSHTTVQDPGDSLAYYSALRLSQSPTACARGLTCVLHFASHTILPGAGLGDGANTPRSAVSASSVRCPPAAAGPCVAAVLHT